MSIYRAALEPPFFPITDQHPLAKREQIGRYWVDYTDPKPSVEEVRAMAEPTTAELRAQAQAMAAAKVADKTTIEPLWVKIQEFEDRLAVLERKTKNLPVVL